MVGGQAVGPAAARQVPGRLVPGRQKGGEAGGVRDVPAAPEADGRCVPGGHGADLREVRHLRGAQGARVQEH